MGGGFSGEEGQRREAQMLTETDPAKLLRQLADQIESGQYECKACIPVVWYHYNNEDHVGTYGHTQETESKIRAAGILHAALRVLVS